MTLITIGFQNSLQLDMIRESLTPPAASWQQVPPSVIKKGASGSGELDIAIGGASVIQYLLPNISVLTFTVTFDAEGVHGVAQVPQDVDAIPIAHGDTIVFDLDPVS